jgi:hypothetical protein
MVVVGSGRGAGGAGNDKKNDRKLTLGTYIDFVQDPSSKIL